MAYEEVYVEFWSTLKKKERKKIQEKLRELNDSKETCKKRRVRK